MKNKKLTLVPDAYRHWSAIFAQLAHRMWVKEFRDQYGWGPTDICVVWDGELSTFYRDPDEHLMGLYNVFSAKFSEDPSLGERMANQLVEEMLEAERVLGGFTKERLETLSWEQLSIAFEEFLSFTAKPGPNLFISVYFPKAIEYMGAKNVFEREVAVLVDARSKIDHVLGPMGNATAETFAEVILEKGGIDGSYKKIISIEQCVELMQSQSEEVVQSLREALEEKSKHYLMADGVIQNLTLEEYAQKHGWKLIVFDLDVKELKGNVAYKDKPLIKGVVKVIVNPEQLGKINDGDIIVAPMTTPEYEAAMMRATAIITDEGGITCHAAIIAREFKIPTIVGTKIASKLLQDGDMVEVDANKGIVKKL